MIIIMKNRSIFLLFYYFLDGVCLISQEVWFAIYSTVGAFYIPLGVMLFMYLKIYAEASKFATPRKKTPKKAFISQVSIYLK